MDVLLPRLLKGIFGTACVFIACEAAIADMNLIPTDVIVSNDGSEAIIEFEADFGGGVIDTGTLYIDGNRFSITGTTILPTANNQLMTSYTPPAPCTPNPVTGICEVDPFGEVYDTNPFDDGYQSHVLPADSGTEWIHIPIVIGVCAVGYGVAYGLNVHACSDNGGIRSQNIGACGMFQGASLRCFESDDTPPEEREVPEEPEPPLPPPPPTPPSTPPDCVNGDCSSFWNWNSGLISGCLSHNPAACF